MTPFTQMISYHEPVSGAPSRRFVLCDIPYCYSKSMFTIFTIQIICNKMFMSVWSCVNIFVKLVWVVQDGQRCHSKDLQQFNPFRTYC